MPGLITIIDSRQSTSIDKLSRRMGQAIKHQPEQTIHTWIDEDRGVALGRVSTGIFNPEPQPIFNEDRTLAIIMEGEIFDYEDLKNDLISKGHLFTINNDPEFVLHLYDEFGEDFVKRLNGFFVAVIWDRPKQRLIITNDRYGFRPLYWAQVNSRLLICSEIKGILEDRAFRREVNHQGVAEFFGFGHLFGENTLLKNVQLLPSASLWVYQNQSFSRKKYWCLDQHMEADTRPQKQYLEEITFLFKRAVQRQLKGDFDIAISLTGGLDSRAIIAAIEPISSRIHSFLHGAKGCTDEKLAQRVAADTTGDRHHFYELGSDFLSNFPKYANQTVYLSDGMCKLGLVQVLFSREIVRHYANIEFNASGAEISRNWCLTPQILASKNEAELLQSSLGRYRTPVSEVNLFNPAYYQVIKGCATYALQQILSGPRNDLALVRKANSFGIREHYRKLFMQSWVLAANYLEYRNPFWDNDYVDLIIKAPISLQIYEESKIPKFIIQKNNPALAKIPIEVHDIATHFYESKFYRRAVRHPKQILMHRSKKYFPWLGRFFSFPQDYINYPMWMRNEIRPFVEEILLDRRTLERGYYNSEYVKQMVVSHMSGKENFASQLSLMLGFELWHRLFLD